MPKRILKPFKYLNKVTSLGDKIIAPIVIAGATIVGIHLYQVLIEDYPFVVNAVVYSPIETDKKTYQIGETVSGNFIGDRFTDNPVIFHRTLFCENYRAILNSVRVEQPPIGRINGFSPIITLDGSSLLDDNLGFAPATDCVVIFNPESVVGSYLLGGERRQTDQSFSTDRFDIVEAE